MSMKASFASHDNRDTRMSTILKGIFALPITMAVVCAAIFAGTVILMIIGLLAALIVAAVPFLLRLLALSFIVFGTLWLLGSLFVAAQSYVENKIR